MAELEQLLAFEVPEVKDLKVYAVRTPEGTIEVVKEEDLEKIKE